MNTLFWIAPAAGAAALLCALWLYSWIGKNSDGNDRMREIASYIRSGAMAFLFREYRTIVIFVAAMFVLLTFAVNLGTAGTFLLGALFSVLAGFFGMRTATSANVRTAAAAEGQGMNHALKVAFRGGAVMGLCVVGLGVLGVGVLTILLGVEHADMLTGFGLGASSIALFGRVGGGIYTKAADVGADLVGKVEVGIPEDDPRNPAVIADNVGDNVGDVAGMGADLFGSFAESTCAALVVASTSDELNKNWGFMMFPLLVSAGGILSSFLTSFFATSVPGLKVTQERHVERNLSIQLYISTIFATVAVALMAQFFLPDRFCSRVVEEAVNGSAGKSRN